MAEVSAAEESGSSVRSRGDSSERSRGDSSEGDDVAVGELVDDGLDAAEAAVVSDLEQLTVERDELRVVAQRLQADFENYKKRMLREQTIAIERANERLLETLLPVLDSFELAQRSLEGPDDDIDKLRGGVLAAIRQLVDTIGKEGLERIDALGAPFDPSEHEAVMHDDGDGAAVVVEVFRTGYRLKGRVVRPAMVKVGPRV
jgi:molecular chaperone GrpE